MAKGPVPIIDLEDKNCDEFFDVAWREVGFACVVGHGINPILFSSMRTLLKKLFALPKMKTKKSAAKRFKKTGSGLKRKKSNKSHILTKMTTKRKRQLRGTTKIAKGDQVLVDRMLKTKS